MQKLLLIPLALLVISLFSLEGCGNNGNRQNRMHRNMMQDGMMHRGQDNQRGRRMMGAPGDSAQNRGSQRYDSEAFRGEGVGTQQLSREEARGAAEKYLKSLGNQGLQLGQDSERSDSFTFPVIKKGNGQQIASLKVDKKTGAVHSRK